MMHHVGKGRHHICQVTRQEAVHLYVHVAASVTAIATLLHCCSHIAFAIVTVFACVATIATAMLLVCI